MKYYKSHLWASFNLMYPYLCAFLWITCSNFLILTLFFTSYITLLLWLTFFLYIKKAAFILHCLLLFRDDPLSYSVPFGQPFLHVHRFCPQQHRARSATPHHPGLCLWNLLHPLGYTDRPPAHISWHVFVFSSCFCGTQFFFPLLSVSQVWLWWWAWCCIFPV